MIKQNSKHTNLRDLTCNVSSSILINKRKFSENPVFNSGPELEYSKGSDSSPQRGSRLACRFGVLDEDEVEGGGISRGSSFICPDDDCDDNKGCECCLTSFCVGGGVVGVSAAVAAAELLVGLGDT